MKLTVKDLTISDLISCKSIKERFAKITEIYKQLDYPFKQMVSLNANGLRYCVTIDEIEAIPLTEEILKANGFEVCYESYYQTKFNIWSFAKKACVEYKISELTEDYNHLKIFIYGDERVSIPIRYVHELQHALRLCGLNELADNFKIE